MYAKHFQNSLNKHRNQYKNTDNPHSDNNIIFNVDLVACVGQKCVVVNEFWFPEVNSKIDCQEKYLKIGFEANLGRNTEAIKGYLSPFSGIKDEQVKLEKCRFI